MRTEFLILLLPLLLLAGCDNPYNTTINQTTNVNPIQPVVNQTIIQPVVNERAVSTLDALIPYPNNLSVYYFSVGRADSELIVLPDNVTVLVDGGNVGDGVNIVRLLRNLGIEKLDYVVVSHLHDDHYGSLEYIMFRIPTNKVIRSGTSCTSDSCNVFLNSLGNTTQDFVGFDGYYNFGEEDVVSRFFVPYDSGQGFSSNENDNSILLKITFGKYSFLFTGDCEEECEERLGNVDLKADFLKIAHHGSCTSSSLVFLKKVAPLKVLATVGRDDVVCGEVLSRLNYLDIPLYRTSEGSFVVTTNGDSVGYGVKKI